MRPSAQPFSWKWVLFAWEWKIISTSKAEHLTSFDTEAQGNSEMAYSELKTVSKVIEMENTSRDSQMVCQSCMPTTVDQPTFALYTGATSVQGQTPALILCVSLSTISKNVNG